VLWPPVERLLASSPADFAAAFGRMTGIARGVFTGLGLLTSVLILISLVREGGIGARRGRLRLLAIVALVGAGLVGALVIDPAQGAILAAARTATASLPPLLESWSRWGLVNQGMALVALIALVFAHRAPVVASTGAGTLSPANRKLLLLLSTATFFEGYDRFIVTLALPYIAHDLGASEGVLGWSLSVIRGGALLAIVLCLMADRVGRRGVLLWTVLGYTLVTADAGFAHVAGLRRETGFCSLAPSPHWRRQLTCDPFLIEGLADQRFIQQRPRHPAPLRLTSGEYVQALCDGLGLPGSSENGSMPDQRWPLRVERRKCSEWKRA